MTKTDRIRQRAIFHLLGIVVFLGLAMPPAVLVAVHRASGYAADYGGPLEVASVRFAWPVYLLGMCVLFWAIAVLSRFLDANDADYAEARSARTADVIHTAPES